MIAGGLFLVHMLLRYGSVWWWGPWPQNGGINAIALGFATIGLLPWITDFLSGAKLPGGFEGRLPQATSNLERGSYYTVAVHRRGIPDPG